MIIIKGVKHYRYSEAAEIAGVKRSAFDSWMTRSGVVVTVKFSHSEAKDIDPTYTGRKGIKVVSESTIEVYMSRHDAGVSATVRGTDIHQRTMQVDYIRDEPRSYQARYIKDISVDGFVAEFAVESGKIDAFYCDGKTAHIVDFKTGAFGDYSEQMNKYVKDIRSMYPTVKIMTHVIYTDQWETEVKTY